MWTLCLFARIARLYQSKHNPMSITFAQKLRTLRQELHFEQSDVARCLGVDAQKIKRFELGAQEPTFTDLCGLLATFMTRFDAEFKAELGHAMAEVNARVADYIPPKSISHTTTNRAKSYQRLKTHLNQPHGFAL